jgi:hypothetical protein
MIIVEILIKAYEVIYESALILYGQIGNSFILEKTCNIFN